MLKAALTKGYQMKKLTILFILVLPLYLTGCKSTEGLIHSDQIISLDKDLKSLQEDGRFNGAVLVAQNEDIIFMNTYGYTDYTRTKRLTPQSSFRLASVSKQFTAAAIMILKDRIQLDFDDDITQYLQELDYEGITIRHLLNHTSGLVEIYQLDDKYFQGLTILTNPDVLNIFKEHPIDLNFSPGSKFSYSNTGYIFLSEIISRISGLTFEAFLKNEIFEPLKMENSSVVNLLSSKDVLPNRTRGFIGDSDNSYTPVDGVSGDGSVFLSIEDFLLWAKALRENSIISESTWKEALSHAILNNGKKSYYGFGWFLSRDNSFIQHSGEWLSARTYIKMDLINNGLVVVLDSSSNIHTLYKMELFYDSLFE